MLRSVAEADLDTPVPVPPAPWNPPDVAAWSVRWVWLHVVEELARHAGHADIVRELVDGAAGMLATVSNLGSEDPAERVAHHARVQAAAEEWEDRAAPHASQARGRPPQQGR